MDKIYKGSHLCLQTSNYSILLPRGVLVSVIAYILSNFAIKVMLKGREGEKDKIDKYLEIDRNHTRHFLL